MEKNYISKIICLLSQILNAIKSNLLTIFIGMCQKKRLCILFDCIKLIQMTKNVAKPQRL